MVDFNNKMIFKLKEVPETDFLSMVLPIFIDGEVIIGSFRSMRDGVVFTNKRIISINVQGLTGKKRDFTTLPYSKIQAYSVETAGTFDLDSELDLWFSGMGKIRFEFNSNTDVAKLCRVISSFVL